MMITRAIRYVVPVALLVVVAAIAAASDDGGDRQLTLDEAKRLAFRRNWDLLAAKSDVDAADAQRIVAEEFPNPIFSWSTARIGLDRASEAVPTGAPLWDRSLDSIFAVNQLFEIGGKRSARQRSAGAGFDAARARLADARRTLDAGVTKAYVAAALAADSARILTESAGHLRREADIARVRFRSGDISQSDLDRIELAAQQDELAAAGAEANAVQQRLAVETLLGVKSPKGAWVAADSVEALANLPPAAAPTAPERPDLAAARAAQKQAESDVKLQKAYRVPDPTVLVFYEHQPPDTNNTLGIGLSFPLPLWNWNNGAIGAAAASRDKAALAVEQTAAAVAADIATARSTCDEALARWRRYRDQLRPKSGQIREAVSYAYEKGGAALLDLLEAQRDDNTVRLGAAQAAADAATAAAALSAALNGASPAGAGPAPTPSKE